MKLSNKFYNFCILAGKFLGCHQRPDRSFFIHGHQFPVCARCTGVFVGECIGIICFRFVHFPVVLLLAFCGLMFLDWLIQFLQIRESNNSRRFITGILCGYAYCTCFFKCLLTIKNSLNTRSFQ